MKTKTYLRNLFPSLATMLGMLVLPFVLSIYFVVTRYSQTFITDQQVNYFDVQSNWLGQVFVNQAWIEWFNRFMDFAFWGVLAAIVLVLAWGFSSAKISLRNHYDQQGFTNFSTEKNSWHSHFFVVFALKVILITIIVYSVLAIIAQQIPQLAVRISAALVTPDFDTIKLAVISGLMIVFYQFLIITSVKVFKHLNAE